MQTCGNTSLVEDFCSFCPTLPGFPCHPVTSPDTLPVTLSPCRFPCHFARPPMSALSVPLLVSHVSPPCIHELMYLFCQALWYVCRQNLRGLFQAFRIQQQVRVTFECICEARTCCWALTCGCGTPSVAPEIILKDTPRFCFGLLHVWLTCLWTWIYFFCAALWHGRNFQSKECFAT